MGLFNKLKNAIFEEEEVEINEPEKEVVKEKEAPKPAKRKEPVKMTFDGGDEDIVSDRELFKAEPTFNFPAFDEDEFVTQKKPEPKPEPRPQPRKEMERTMEVKPRTTAPTVLDMERSRSRAAVSAPKRNHDYIEARENRDTRKVSASPAPVQHFVPSPVISPVYGVLDKNYKKEDIIVKGGDTKKIDVDSVRKKAFGTLEEDIEKTLNTPSRDFYQKEKDMEPRSRREQNHHLDDLLKDAAEDVIPIPEKEESFRTNKSYDVEEEMVRYRKKKPVSMEPIDEPVKKSVEEKLEDETLENDLFDLIDSMYETREDD